MLIVAVPILTIFSVLMALDIAPSYCQCPRERLLPL